MEEQTMLCPSYLMLMTTALTIPMIMELIDYCFIYYIMHRFNNKQINIK